MFDAQAISSKVAMENEMNKVRNSKFALPKSYLAALNGNSIYIQQMIFGYLIKKGNQNSYVL